MSRRYSFFSIVLPLLLVCGPPFFDGKRFHDSATRLKTDSTLHSISKSRTFAQLAADFRYAFASPAITMDMSSNQGYMAALIVFLPALVIAYFHRDASDKAPQAERDVPVLQPASVPLTYRADIDGLRALAVVPVIIYHFGLGCPGGFAGVDVFFVISGYLITCICLKDISSESFSLRSFWARRVRRIFPALCAVLAAVLLVGWFLLLASAYSSLAQQTRAVLLMTANFQFFETGEYFFNPQEFPLLHCWSLAVEEQFYLIYPSILFALWKLKGTNGVVGGLMLIFSVSLTVSITLTSAHKNFAYFLLPARAWELAMGGLLAFDNGPSVFSSDALAEVASWLGVLLIVGTYCFVNSTYPYPGAAALLPCCGAALIISSQRANRTSFGFLISHRVPVFIGKISYSLYLWHWPVYVFLMYMSVGDELLPGQASFGIALSVLAAVLSYYFVENVFRSQTKISNHVFYPLMVTIWCTLIFFTVYVSRTGVGGIHGQAELIEQKTTCGNLAITAAERIIADPAQKGSSDKKCLRWLSDAELDCLYNVDLSNIRVNNILASKGWEAGQFNFGSNGNKPYLAGPIASGGNAAGENPAVAIIGNSHCEMHGPLLERLAQSYGVSIAFLCADGGSQGQFKKPLRDWDQKRLDYLEKWRPQQIVWLDFWDGDTGAPWQFEGYDFDYAFSLLAPLTKKITVFGDVPTLPISKKPSNDLLKKTVLQRYKVEGGFDFLQGLMEDADYHTRRVAVEAKIKSAAHAVPDGRGNFVPLAPYFVDGKTQHLQLVDPAKGTLGYKDFSHLNADGGSRLDQVFMKEIFNQKLCAR